MLYIVATPIGNLDEITLRALEVLRGCDTILAEDTRRTAILAEKYGIKKPMLSCQRFNEAARADFIAAELKAGKTLALVSDAGMPLISDPGALIVKRLREENLPYTVISGPCACINALVLSGLDSARFLMAGFLPEKQSQREALLLEYKALTCTLLFYVSVHNVKKDAEFLFSVLGARRAALVREISKKFEEVIPFTLGELPPLTEKGEFVLAVEGFDERTRVFELSVFEQLRQLVEGGTEKKEAVKIVAKMRGIPRNEVYAESLKL